MATWPDSPTSEPPGAPTSEPPGAPVRSPSGATAGAPLRPLIGLAELTWLHDLAIAEFGGAPGIRDQGMLESALARPVAGFAGTPAFPEPFDRAGALVEALILDHGFVDGNKRTAVMAGALWLEREGTSLEARPGELVDLALAVAEHRMDAADIASWLEARGVALQVAREPTARKVDQPTLRSTGRDLGARGLGR